MKTVTISDKFKVTIDSSDNNHTLYTFIKGGKQVKVPKTGEIKITEDAWQVVGYYPNMKQCLTGCIGLSMASGQGTQTIKQYLEELKSITKDLSGRLTK